MASLASNMAERAKGTWGRLNPTQRLLVGGLGVALAGAIALGVYLNRPEWVVLVSGADPKEAAAMVQKLNEAKIPNQQAGDGYTIQVHKSDLYTAKLAMAQAGLPKGGGAGLEIFNTPSMGWTDFDRKVNYQSSLQTELERALMRMNFEYANVKLVIPEKTVFTRTQQAPTAAVLLHPKSGRMITSQEVLAVMNFVASSSVPGMLPENVKVVDKSGRLLSNGLVDSTGLGVGQGLSSEQIEQQKILERDAEQKIMNLLERSFGLGKVMASVNVELNTEARKVESTTFGGSTPKSTTTTKEAAQGAKAAPTSTGQNDPSNPPTYQADGGASSGGDAWKTTTTTQNEVSKTSELALSPAGGVKRLSVGIVIDSDTVTPEQEKSIREVVSSSTGADPNSVSIMAMSFARDLPAGLLPTADNKLAVQPATLAIGLGSAALVLLVGFFATSRRQREDEVRGLEPMLASFPVAPMGGPSTLDVALGLDSPAGLGPGPALGGAPMMPSGTPMMGDQGMMPLEDDGPNTTVVQSPKQKLEIIMAQKPKRQIILDGQPVDEEIMAHVDELIDSSPEACAEVLRQWMKGGT